MATTRRRVLQLGTVGASAFVDREALSHEANLVS